ncbi:T9SS type A sorting domain-containing protein [Parabacteroides sp. FAFU027]|uniref:T9SS type A sorting domain-containing protein n=1 Tax=Parabacteroides sp. FAFU027 TaxID=2922715 RepID=UPI001FAF646B|nr:T9SS type A sorting domain-containing protein [Parabacteroides sp. FAFU027]
MKTSSIQKHNPLVITCIIWCLSASVISTANNASAQTILFDFDNAPLHSSLPINLTAGGITAYFSATGQGFSIQEANALGFTPQGFAGQVIYPNSIYLADLHIHFDQMLSYFSIMYACQELGCDDAATMRVTAYSKGSLIGTATMTATNPGTWPVDTLSCSFTQGFDSVVVHYDKRPPTCQDYGVIFMADNMKVIPSNTTGVITPEIFGKAIIAPNPVTSSSTLTFTLLQSDNIRISIYDLTGRMIKTLFNGSLPPGEHKINVGIITKELNSGYYTVNLTGEHCNPSCNLIVK